jgi:hypothetical protein
MASGAVWTTHADTLLYCLNINAYITKVDALFVQLQKTNFFISPQC